MKRKAVGPYKLGMMFRILDQFIMSEVFLGVAEDVANGFAPLSPTDFIGGLKALVRSAKGLGAPVWFVRAWSLRISRLQKDWADGGVLGKDDLVEEDEDEDEESSETTENINPVT